MLLEHYSNLGEAWDASISSIVRWWWVVALSYLLCSQSFLLTAVRMKIVQLGTATISRYIRVSCKSGLIVFAVGLLVNFFVSPIFIFATVIEFNA